jgi:serine/threonine protein kinase
MSSHNGNPLSQKVISKLESLPAVVDESNAPLCATVIGPLAIDESQDAAAVPSNLYRIGRYLLIEKVGAGGFGVVYRARDELLEREVALKIPRRERLQSERAVASFLNEARSAAKLHHPGIVGVYDVGQADDGSYFIAMEFVHGQSLTKLIKQRRLSFDEAGSLVTKIADAVHEAHKQGLVHRDLKPSNVLVDGAMEPHVVDFGIAVSEDQQRNLAGDIAGTVPYMSPEQVVGEVHLMDGRTDIWSLGVILYQLLTGRHPFGGNHATDLLEQILRRNPKPPRQIDDRIPKRLEAVVLKALQKHPPQRFNTMRDLADALRECGDDESSHQANLASESHVEGTMLQSSRKTWGGVFHKVGLYLLPILCAVALIINLTASRRGKDGASLDPSKNAMSAGIIRNVWQPMLVARPREALWSRFKEGGVWNHDADARSLSIDSQGLGMLKIEETNAASFKLQVGILKNSQSGQAGVFFGHHDSLEPDGSTATQMQAIYLLCYRDEQGQQAFDIRRDSITLVPTSVGVPSVRRYHKLACPVPQPPLEEITLEIDIVAGRLNAVRWGGLVLKQLADHDIGPDNPPPECRGTFGVFNELGATQFRNVQFMITSD